jgi:hypothetical protein
MGADLLSGACCVDAMSHYTTEMWDILTDVVLHEWFGIRLPPLKLPWQGAIYLPDGCRLIYCFDRHDARRVTAEIHHHYDALNREGDSMSIFAGYGLSIPADVKRERDGLSFLARQAEYFRSLDDYLFIVQDG